MLGDNPSDAPCRVRHVTLASRDQMTMGVSDRLAGDLTAVPTDIEAVDAFCDELSTELLERRVRVFKLTPRQLKVVTSVQHGDDQKVAGRHRVPVGQNVDGAQNSRIRRRNQLTELAITSHFFIPTLDFTASTNSWCIPTMSASNA